VDLERPEGRSLPMSLGPPCYPSSGPVAMAAVARVAWAAGLPFLSSHHRRSRCWATRTAALTRLYVVRRTAR
jgi:hypothetical protein